MSEDIKPAPRVLDQSDTHTVTWVKLKKHLEATQKKLRTRLETDLSEMDTASVRGQLRVIRMLLALEAPAPATPEQTDDQ